jgi:hypothetical protein
MATSYLLRETLENALPPDMVIGSFFRVSNNMIQKHYKRSQDAFLLNGRRHAASDEIITHMFRRTTTEFEDARLVYYDDSLDWVHIEQHLAVSSIH